MNEKTGQYKKGYDNEGEDYLADRAVGLPNPATARAPGLPPWERKGLHHSEHPVQYTQYLAPKRSGHDYRFFVGPPPTDALTNLMPFSNPPAALPFTAKWWLLPARDPTPKELLCDYLHPKTRPKRRSDDNHGGPVTKKTRKTKASSEDEFEIEDDDLREEYEELSQKEKASVRAQLQMTLGSRNRASVLAEKIEGVSGLSAAMARMKALSADDLYKLETLGIQQRLAALSGV